MKKQILFEYALSSCDRALLECYRYERGWCRSQMFAGERRFRGRFRRRVKRIMPVMVWGKSWDAPLELGPHPLEQPGDQCQRQFITCMRWRISGLHKNMDPADGLKWKFHWAGNWPIGRVPSKLMLSAGDIRGDDVAVYLDLFKHLTALNAYYVGLRRTFLDVFNGLRNLHGIRPQEIIALTAASPHLVPHQAQTPPWVPTLVPAPTRARTPAPGARNPMLDIVPAPSRHRDYGPDLGCRPSLVSKLGVAPTKGAQ